MSLFSFWRRALALALCCNLAFAEGTAETKTMAPAVTLLRVSARPAVPDLQCAISPASTTPSAPVDMDQREVPDEEDVQAALSQVRTGQANEVLRNGLGQAAAGETYRVAIWGDSHLAAGFFTQELVKILKLESDQVRTGWLPANMNRPGVRLPVRKTCVSPGWRYEPAHAVAAGAAAPGPGLVNLVSSQSGASLAWDLRNATGVPESKQVRLLYQQTASPMQWAISVDGEPEFEVTLSATPGPAVLELMADGPLSVIRMRLVSGDMRFHGLALPVPSTAALQMDVFGYPGATLAGWKQLPVDAMAAWFASTRYHLVMMEFGTNEGNVKPFDAVSYQQGLRTAVKQMRTVFPDAACVLIAPGDRGVLVRRSEKIRRPAATVQKKGGRPQAKASASKSRGSKPTRVVAAAPSVVSDAGKNLLQYTRIHEDIGRMQSEVAQEQGCRVWSMLKAMGGQGGAYRWVRQNPPLMARDLIHFTVPGYQQLAQQFASDMGWDATQLWSSVKP